MASSASLDVLIITIVLSVLVVAGLALRFHARRVQKLKLGMDDYTIIPGALLAIGIGVTNSIGIASIAGDWGMNEKSNFERFTIYNKCQFGTITMSILCLAFTKYSVVSFYRRIFRSRALMHITTVLLVVNALWGVSFFLAVMFQCSPVAGAWDPMVREQARCYNPVNVFYGIAISDMLIDIIILAVPQPTIWRLQMPLRQKVGVSLIMAVGAFILGVSAARVYFFVEAGRATDPNQNPFSESFGRDPDVGRPSYWTHVECTVAVVCACLPTLRVLFVELSLSNFRSLRSLASKLSLRSSSKGSQDDSMHNKSFAEKLSSEADQDQSYRCEAFGSYPSPPPPAQGPDTWDNGIVVSKTVHQSHVPK